MLLITTTDGHCCHYSSSDSTPSGEDYSKRQSSVGHVSTRKNNFKRNNFTSPCTSRASLQVISIFLYGMPVFSFAESSHGATVALPKTLIVSQHCDVKEPISKISTLKCETEFMHDALDKYTQRKRPSADALAGPRASSGNLSRGALTRNNV